MCSQKWARPEMLTGSDRDPNNLRTTNRKHDVKKAAASGPDVNLSGVSDC